MEYLSERLRDVASYAVALAEIAHVLLSHSSRTAVEPATMEAELVKRADEVAASAIRARATDDLRSI